MSGTDDFYALVAQALNRHDHGEAHASPKPPTTTSTNLQVATSGSEGAEELLLRPDEPPAGATTDLSGLEVRTWRFLPGTKRDGTDPGLRQQNAKRLQEIKLGTEQVAEAEELERLLASETARSIVDEGIGGGAPPRTLAYGSSPAESTELHSLLPGVDGDGQQSAQQQHQKEEPQDPEIEAQRHPGEGVAVSRVAAVSGGSSSTINNKSNFPKPPISSVDLMSQLTITTPLSKHSRQLVAANAAIASLSPRTQQRRLLEESTSINGAPPPKGANHSTLIGGAQITLLDRYMPNWTQSSELPPRERTEKFPTSSPQNNLLRGRSAGGLVSSPRVTKKANGKGRSCIIQPETFTSLNRVPTIEESIETENYFTMKPTDSAYSSRPEDIARRQLQDEGATAAQHFNKAAERVKSGQPSTSTGAAGCGIARPHEKVSSRDMLLPQPPQRRPHVAETVAETVDIDRAERMQDRLVRLGGRACTAALAGDDGASPSDGLGVSTKLGRPQNVSPTRRSGKIIMMDHTSAYLFDDTNNWILFFDPREQVSTMQVSTVVTYNRLQNEAGPVAIRLMKVDDGGMSSDDEDPNSPMVGEKAKSKSRRLHLKRRQHPGVDLTLSPGQSSGSESEGEGGGALIATQRRGNLKVNTVEYWKTRTHSLIAPSAQKMPKSLERGDLLEVLEGDEMELLVATRNRRANGRSQRGGVSPPLSTTGPPAPSSKSIFSVSKRDRRRRDFRVENLVWNIEATGRFKPGSGISRPYGWNWFSPTRLWEEEYNAHKADAATAPRDDAPIHVPLSESMYESPRRRRRSSVATSVATPPVASPWDGGGSSGAQTARGVPPPQPEITPLQRKASASPRRQPQLISFSSPPGESEKQRDNLGRRSTLARGSQGVTDSGDKPIITFESASFKPVESAGSFKALSGSDSFLGRSGLRRSTSTLQPVSPFRPRELALAAKVRRMSSAPKTPTKQ